MRSSKNSRLSTKIFIYFGQKNGSLTESPRHRIELCHFRRPWMTFQDGTRVAGWPSQNRRNFLSQERASVFWNSIFSFDSHRATKFGMGINPPREQTCLFLRSTCPSNQGRGTPVLPKCLWPNYKPTQKPSNKIMMTKVWWAESF